MTIESIINKTARATYHAASFVLNVPVGATVAFLAVSALERAEEHFSRIAASSADNAKVTERDTISPVSRRVTIDPVPPVLEYRGVVGEGDRRSAIFEVHRDRINRDIRWEYAYAGKSIPDQIDLGCQEINYVRSNTIAGGEQRFSLQLEEYRKAIIGLNCMILR